MNDAIFIVGQEAATLWIIEALTELHKVTSQILEKENTIMAKVIDLEAKLDSIAKIVESVAVDQTELKNEIQALKDQVAAGGTITEAQLDSPLAKATALEARLQGIDASVPPADPVP